MNTTPHDLDTLDLLEELARPTTYANLNLDNWRT